MCSRQRGSFASLSQPLTTTKTIARPTSFASMTLADWLNGAPSPTAPPPPPPSRAPTLDSPSPTSSSTTKTAATPRRSPSATATDSDSPWLDACLRLDPTNPLLVASATALSLVAATRVWNRYGRRVRNADSLKSEDLLKGSRRLKGYVTRCVANSCAQEKKEEQLGRS